MLAYLFHCNKCQTWGTGQTQDIRTYTYHCFRCNRKERVILKNKGTRVIHKGPFSAQNAPKIVQEINKKQSINSNLDFK